MTDTKNPKSNVVDLASRRKVTAKTDFDQKFHVLIRDFLMEYAEKEDALSEEVSDLILENDVSMTEEEHAMRIGSHAVSLSASLVSYMASMYCFNKESAHEFVELVSEAAHNMTEESNDFDE